MTATLLGTYKAPVYADVEGQPRVGTLRVPLDLAGEGIGADGSYELRVEPLTPDLVLHADGHDDCPATITLDVITDDRTVVGQLTCCDLCRP